MIDIALNGKTMTGPRQHLVTQLERLRTELADLAFDLERQGRLDAADVTNAIASRLAEIGAASGPAVRPPVLRVGWTANRFFS